MLQFFQYLIINFNIAEAVFANMVTRKNNLFKRKMISEFLNNQFKTGIRNRIIGKVEYFHLFVLHKIANNGIQFRIGDVSIYQFEFYTIVLIWRILLLIRAISLFFLLRVILFRHSGRCIFVFIIKAIILLIYKIKIIPLHGLRGGPYPIEIRAIMHIVVDKGGFVHYFPANRRKQLRCLFIHVLISTLQVRCLSEIGIVQFPLAHLDLWMIRRKDVKLVKGRYPLWAVRQPILLLIIDILLIIIFIYLAKKGGALILDEAGLFHFMLLSYISD